VMLGITTAEALEGAGRLAALIRGDKVPDGSVRCWWCGTEPDSLINVTRYDQAEPEYLPNWPAATDHHHAERPPTPGQLEQAGHEALMRIRHAGM
jgi:hypothetical protein